MKKTIGVMIPLIVFAHLANASERSTSLNRDVLETRADSIVTNQDGTVTINHPMVHGKEIVKRYSSLTLEVAVRRKKVPLDFKNAWVAFALFPVDQPLATDGIPKPFYKGLAETRLLQSLAICESFGYKVGAVETFYDPHLLEGLTARFEVNYALIEKSHPAASEEFGYMRSWHNPDIALFHSLMRLQEGFPQVNFGDWFLTRGNLYMDSGWPGDARNPEAAEIVDQIKCMVVRHEGSNMVSDVM